MQLLLTLDYELFGDGSGDVFKHIIEPTNTILEVAERFGAKITVFFEVVEYWRFKQEWENGNHMGYDRNPVIAMEQQVLDMIKRGHDVQLHLHPQWVDAKWEEDHWDIDYSNWRLSSFSSPSITLSELILMGKQTLENLIKPLFPSYECCAMRAGGYNAFPSQKIVHAIRECGLKMDSSIIPGAKEKGLLSAYDYSNAPLDLGQWYVKDNLELPSDESSNIVEFPIVTFPIYRTLKFLSLTRIKSILVNRKSAQASFAAKTALGEDRSSFVRKVSFFFKKEYQTWDFCLFPCWLHRYYLNQISKQTNRNTFVIIGHPKSLVSTKGLVFLLNKIKGQVNFPTLSEML